MVREEATTNANFELELTKSKLLPSCMCLFGLTACSIRPPFTVDESTHLCKSKHHPRHLPPCAAKVCIAGADDLAVDECESAHIINLFPCLCCYHTQTLCNRIYRGVQVDGFSISKYEIDSALDVAVSKEMPAHVIA